MAGPSVTIRANSGMPSADSSSYWRTAVPVSGGHKTARTRPLYTSGQIPALVEAGQNAERFRDLAGRNHLDLAHRGSHSFELAYVMGYPEVYLHPGAGIDGMRPLQSWE
jgi:hypothetical protein